MSLRLLHPLAPNRYRSHNSLLSSQLSQWLKRCNSSCPRSSQRRKKRRNNQQWLQILAQCQYLKEFLKTTSATLKIWVYSTQLHTARSETNNAYPSSRKWPPKVSSPTHICAPQWRTVNRPRPWWRPAFPKARSPHRTTWKCFRASCERTRSLASTTVNSKKTLACTRNSRSAWQDSKS